MFVKQRVQVGARLALVFAVAVALLISPQSFAEEATSAANTLKVSPVRSDFEVKPGGKKVIKTVVTNLTNEAITVRPIENDFISGNEDGVPALILDADKFAPTHSLKRFMTPLSDVTIPANESRAIDVEIKVPLDAKAGGYFGAVRFAPASPDGGGQVNLSASVASLMLLTVPGDIVEKVALTDFEIQQGGKSNTIFNSSNDLQAFARFENSGNVQVGPIGKVSVKQGDKVVYEADFNNKNPRDVILPDSARRWDIPLKNIGSFGQYTVSATFTFGKKNETIEVTKSFWVIPISIMIATAVGILLLIGLIFGVIYFLRGYKRRIIRNSSGGMRL